MIKIESVEIKKTKKGDDYKALKLSDGRFVNMWNDDIDYSIAEAGAELDRTLVKNGNYWNLTEKGTPEVKVEHNKNEVSFKLEVIFESLKRIEKALGIDSLDSKIKTEMEKTMEKNGDDKLPVDENGDIDPSQIPF